VVLLEQIAPRQFRPHELEHDEAMHATLAVGDFDDDGDVDLAVGNYFPRSRLVRDWLTVWWNIGPAKRGSAIRPQRSPER
jgi:hypothetical protein